MNTQALYPELACLHASNYTSQKESDKKGAGYYNFIRALYGFPFSVAVFRVTAVYDVGNRNI